MPKTEEAEKELRKHQWLCDESWVKLDEVKGHLWKIEVERAKRYGKTDPIAGKADSVMWGIRKQMEGLTDIRDKLQEEDPPGERRDNMPLTKEEVSQIATRTADEVMDRIRERERDSLMLHSIPYAFGSPGIVVNEARAKASPCRCIEYRPGKKLCFSTGIVGALSDEQEEIYCPTTEALESPGLEKRLAGWMESVETCKAEIAEIPKGERLEPWLSCMSRELTAHRIEV